MKIPSRFEVSAAQRCAEIVGQTPVKLVDARDSYRSAVTQGLVAGEDLRNGQQLLEEVGLLRAEVGILVPDDSIVQFTQCSSQEAIEIVLSRLLGRSQPAWLATAAGGSGVRNELIPDTENENLSELIPDMERREALLMSSAQVYDPEDLSEIGALGEEAVVSLCVATLDAAGRPDLARCVSRVSLVSDQLGYDVSSPTTSDSVARLEVKTTRNLRNSVVFLSRNEANTGSVDPNWSLVVCRHQDARTAVEGHCSYTDIAPQLPTDNSPGLWSAARLVIGHDLLRPGLPI